MRWDPELQRIIQEPTEMAQEFRKFDLDTPWEVFPKFRDATIASGYELIETMQQQQHAQQHDGGSSGNSGSGGGGVDAKSDTNKPAPSPADKPQK